MRLLAAPILLALLATACTPPLGPARPGSTNWRVAASDDDRDRLRDWRKTFEDALGKARAAGNGARIDAEGPLLALDAALGGGIPVGQYRCRTIKLGARGNGNRDYVAYAPIPCRIGLSGAVQDFAVVTGAQRPSGFIYPADRLRSVFLGGLSLGDEDAAMRYGTDPDRDMIGWVERIGDARWRILLPSPRLESVTDVIELVPAA